jgi:hypothetical protein
MLRNPAVCPLVPLIALVCFVSKPELAFGQREELDDACVVEKSLSNQEMLAAGYLFVDGQYLPPPYRISLAEDRLQVNDRPIELPPPAENGGMRTLSRSELAVQAFNALCGELRTGNVVCAFQQQPLVSLGSQARRDFLTLVTVGSVSDDVVNRIAGVLPVGLNQQLWNEFVSTVHLTDDLKERAEALISEENVRIAEADSAYAKTRRSHAFTYLLTVFGMVMAVYSTGHLLQWRPPRGNQPSQDMADDVRCVVQCLGLVVILSALDLTWTYLASQQGSMYELNPLGNEMLSQPLRIVLFKSLATAGAVALLFALRHHRRAQMGAWWICLVCTMLTMRWLTFNSMFIS